MKIRTISHEEAKPCRVFNPLSANPTKWSNTLKQLVGNLPTNRLSMFHHFVGLTLKGLKHFETKHIFSHCYETYDKMLLQNLSFGFQGYTELLIYREMKQKISNPKIELYRINASLPV